MSKKFNSDLGYTKVKNHGKSNVEKFIKIKLRLGMMNALVGVKRWLVIFSLMIISAQSLVDEVHALGMAMIEFDKYTYLISTGGPRTNRGVVAAQGLVLEHGHPIWVIFNKDGSIQERIGTTEEYPNSFVMSGEVYLHYFTRLNELIETYGEDNIIVELKSGDDVSGDGNDENEDTLAPNDDVYSLVKNSKTGKVLLYAPVDLTRSKDEAVEEGCSVLLSEKREVISKASTNIGYFTAFYTEKDSTEDLSPEDGRAYGREFLSGFEEDEHQLWGPIQSAEVTNSLCKYSDETNEKGQYGLVYSIPFCYCVDCNFAYENYITATLRYSNFSPRQCESYRGGKYLTTYYAPDDCIIPSSVISIRRYNIAVDIAMLTGMGIWPDYVEAGEDVTKTRFKTKNQYIVKPIEEYDIDLNNDGVSDTVEYNEDETEVYVWYDGQSLIDGQPYNKVILPEYKIDDSEEEELEDTLKPLDEYAFDLNNDGTDDTVEYSSDLKKVLIWFSQADKDAGKPHDLERLPDYKKDLTDQGLLDSIKEDDVKNKTDIYVFRVSNGQLMCSLKGLNSNSFNSVGGINDTGMINYRIPIRGPANTNRIHDDQYFFAHTLDDWQDDYRVPNPEDPENPYYVEPDSPYYDKYSSQESMIWTDNKNTDQLRIGEKVKVVMINRATGYMGTALATMGEDIRGEINLIACVAEPINLQPPNLKIKVERQYDVEYGLNKDIEDPEYIVGFEGSGFSSDNYIKISTEWFDHDGTPLPDDLPGFTGRIAIVTDDNDNLERLTKKSTVENFTIMPGKHMAIVELPEEDDLYRDHYYLHVNGELAKGNPDFSDERDPCFDIAEATGIPCSDFNDKTDNKILKYRPASYVPIKVPIFDEDATKIARKEDPDAEAVYRWVFRPEMQFSIHDLEIDVERDLKLEHNNFTSTDDGKLLIQSSTLDFFAVLLGDDFPVLESFGPDRELVLAVGDHEIELSLDGDNTIQEEDLKAFAQMSSTDLLALMIYQHGDEENILWQYVFPPLVQAKTVEDTDSYLPTFTLIDDKPDVFSLSRVYTTCQFDNAGVPSYYDDYRVFPEYSLDPSEDRIYASLIISDATGDNEARIIDEEEINFDSPWFGKFRFLIDYETVINAGIGVNPGDYFKVKLVTTPTDYSYTRTMNFTGKLELRQEGHFLGQIMSHDVLIQNGSLNLSREDFSVKGRGPSLNFTRSYDNQAMKRGVHPLGAGWSHSFDKRLTISMMGSNGVTPLPDWVYPLRESFFTSSDVEDKGAWSFINVNGTAFVNHNSANPDSPWIAERGRHGTLTEDDTDYIFRAKDGTRYFYSKNELNAGTMFQTESLSPGSTQVPVRRIEDRTGNALVFEYKNGILQTVSVEDSDDPRELTFTHEYIGGLIRLVKVAGPGGIEVAYTYYAQYGTPEFGQLKSVIRGNLREEEVCDLDSDECENVIVGDRTETYEYGPDSAMSMDTNLVKTTDSNGNSKNYTYWSRGEIPEGNANLYLKPDNVVKIVAYPPAEEGGASPEAYFTYDIEQNQRTVNELNGQDTIYTLNNYGNPLRIEEPLGKTTEMTWSINLGEPDNVMRSKADSNGTTTYVYDSKGNITLETDPAGNSISTTWDESYSLPVARTDRNDNSQSWEYDSNGNLTKYTDADDNVASYSYNSTGEPVSKTTPSGTTSYSWDLIGNPSSTTEPEGSTIQTSYDNRGRQTTTTDPKGNVTSYTYDDLDYKSSVTLPGMENMIGAVNTLSFVHDPEGNLVSETDKNGLTTTYEYSARNLVISQNRDGLGSKTFAYDANGNLLSETDWKGQEIKHTYDDLNRRISTTNRLGDTVNMAYDLAGNLTSLTDYEGNTTLYAYDVLNRRISTETTGDGGGIVTNTYFNEADPETNLKTVSDQEGNLTAFEYNGRYLMTKRTDPMGNDYAWTYDGSGNITVEMDEEGHVTTHEYDGQNRRVRTTHPEGVITLFAYDANNNLTVTTTPRGFTIENTYNPWNQLVIVKDPDSYTSEYWYDGMGNIVKTLDGRGVTRTQNRDRRGLVTSVVDGEGETTSYSYDNNGNLLSTTNPKDLLTSNTYDPEDNLLNSCQNGTGLSRCVEILYDKMKNKVRTKDYKGNDTDITYNDVYQPVTVSDPAGNVTITTYFKTGQPKTVTDRRNNSTTYQIDSLGRTTQVTDPENNTTTTTYDNVGNIKTFTDKRGNTTTNTYDGLNRLTSVEKAGIAITKNTYDEDSNVATATDANGNTTTFAYNGRKLLSLTTFQDGNTEQKNYDGAGNLLSVINEEGKATTFTYDDENRQASVTFASETTTTVYDATGHPITVTKPEGNAITMGYDAVDRLVSVDDGFVITTYQYDDNDNLTQVLSGNTTTQYTYNELDRKTKHAQGSFETNFLYDEEGNLTSTTDPENQIITYTYDKLNRQTAVNYPIKNGSVDLIETSGITTQYDGNNNITHITETKTNGYTDETVNVYDGFDRLISTTQRGLAITYAYDNNGNRAGVSSDAGTTTYTYDSMNRIASAVTPSGTTSYTYYPDGKKNTVTYPNGTDIAYVYTVANRVETITNKLTASGSVFSSYAYTYDANGNRLSQTEVQGGISETTTYTYDGIDRMTSYTLTDSASVVTHTVYTFDAYNRKTETVTEDSVITKSRTYAYNDVNWLTQITDDTDSGNVFTIDYAYDNNGNTILKSNRSLTDQDITFTYDSRNQLVQTTRGPPESLEMLGQYDYNAAGLRVRHANSERGNVAYYYDGPAVLEERNADDDQLMAHYRYADRLLSLDTGSEVQYYHQDALGSTVNLTKPDGSVKKSYWLDPYGQIRKEEGEETVNRMVFTGQEHDEQTGLIYFGARYYDPDIARFITQDSYLGEQGVPPSLHRYLYAYANPTVYIDLYGYMGVFFDGTGNDASNPNLGETNVSKLEKAYDSGPKRYIKGVGSDWWTKYNLGGLCGAGGDKRLEEAYEFIVESYNSKENYEKVIDVFGFSRGAAMARAFANIIKERGIPDYSKQIGTKQVRDFEAEKRMREREDGPVSPIYKEVPVYENFKDVNIRFLGIFDTVGSFGVPGNNVDIGLDFSVDPNFVKNTRHAVAKDEYRVLFDLQSVRTKKNGYLPSNVIEKEFRGAHSDVGGGYKEGEDGKSNDLANIPLHWMYDEATKSGVKLNPLKQEDNMPDISRLSEKELTEKYIHDSRYFYEKYILHRKKRDTFYQKNGNDYKQPFTKLNEDELKGL